MIPKIMPQILGKRDGGCWMVTWPFSILRPSRSLYSYGAPAKTIEDKFGLLYIIPEPYLLFFLYIDAVR